MSLLSLPASGLPVEDQDAAPWSDPEVLETAVVRALDELLGHDVDRLAGVSGISRRELNKQRERGRKIWLARLCQLGRAAFDRFGAERTEPAARLFAQACGHDLARAVPATAADGNREGALQLLACAMREFGQASSRFAAAAADGIDAREAEALIPEVDQAAAALAAVRQLLVIRSIPRRGAKVSPLARPA